jgi:Mg-chelatase subunit ChlD
MKWQQAHDKVGDSVLFVVDGSGGMKDDNR